MVKKKYKPVSEKIPNMLHGADYNPEQWEKYPEILEEDIRLMKKANCNVMSIGMFSWWECKLNCVSRRAYGSYFAVQFFYCRMKI